MCLCVCVCVCLCLCVRACVCVSACVSLSVSVCARASVSVLVSLCVAVCCCPRPSILVSVGLGLLYMSSRGRTHTIASLSLSLKSVFSANAPRKQTHFPDKRWEPGRSNRQVAPSCPLRNQTPDSGPSQDCISLYIPPLSATRYPATLFKRRGLSGFSRLLMRYYCAKDFEQTGSEPVSTALSPVSGVQRK